MISIQKKDSIIDIIEKIEKQDGINSELILNFPLGHPVLHNTLSLKLLLVKVKKSELIVQTKDVVGIRICKNLGIRIYKERQENKNVNILKENYQFGEYAIYLIKSYFDEFYYYITKQKNKKIYKKYKNNIFLIQVFILIPTFALVIFFLVYYFAINKTFITLYPESTVKKEALNFILSPKVNSSILNNNNTIQLEQISKKVLSSQSYSAQEVENSLMQSSGNIKVLNYGEEAISLKPKTRFQDSTGIVFRTEEWINIPAGVKDNFGEITPGTKKIRVTADTKDISGKRVGARGNIDKDTKLIVPGLPDTLQSTLYGISLEHFTGGSETITREVTKKNLEKTRKLFLQKLKEEAIRELRKDIQKRNTINNSSLKLLSIPKTIIFSQKDISLETGIKVGSKVDNFTYNGSLEIRGYIYESQKIIQKLSDIFQNKRIEGVEFIKRIDTSSLRMSEIISMKQNPLRVKATFEVLATSYKDISKEEYQNYVRNLKNKIRGLPVTHGQSILINQELIDNVKIRTRPFFIDKISNIIDNIYFQIEA